MFNDELFSSGSGEIEIDCVGPSVTVKKTPAVFVSKSNDPETFVSSVSYLALVSAAVLCLGNLADLRNTKACFHGYLLLCSWRLLVDVPAVLQHLFCPGGQD